MNETRFEALVVDFGGVLTSPLQDAMENFARDVGIELQDLVRVALAAYSGEEDRLVTDFETGKISEEDFAVEFAQRLSEVAARPVEAKDLVQKIFRLRLEEDMLAAVGAARAAGLRTGLLSNSWGTKYYPRDRLDPLFDVIVISGEVGLRKPDPAIYALTTEKLGVPPAACVFVDDHPGHLAAALDHGMKTVLHRNPQRTIAELEELLALPLH